MKKLLFIGCQLLAISAIAQVKDTALHTLPGDTAIKGVAAPVVISALPPAPDTSIHLYMPAIVQNAEDKVYQYQRYNHGTSPGFRVQIDFAQEQNEIGKVQTGFSAKYPGVPCYITYKQPYFKLNVGDFRNKLQAVDFLNKIRKDYPGAFVVADRIMPPPL